MDAVNEAADPQNTDPRAPDLLSLDEHPGLTHLRQDGTAHMVDVSNKAESTREATATATVRSTAEVLALLGAGELPKGDALAVARRNFSTRRI